MNFRKDIYERVKYIMKEQSEMKVNCSKLGRQFNCDRRTVSRYVELAKNGEKPSQRVYQKKTDGFEHIIEEKVKTTGNTVTYQTVYVKEQSDASLPHAEQKTVGGKTYYVFPCSVAAKEMNSTITAQIIDGDNLGKKYTYSVKHYADYLLANADSEGTDEQKAYAKALPLVQEMLQYGSCARAYFDGKDISDILSGEIPETFASFTSSLPDEGTYAGATLSLKSETTLSLYFTKKHILSDISCVDKDDNARTVETAASGKYQVIRIRNIAASELQDNFTVSFKIDGRAYSITYSPMNYCYKVQNGGSDDTKLQKVVKALYRYSQVANVYFSEEG